MPRDNLDRFDIQASWSRADAGIDGLRDDINSSVADRNTVKRVIEITNGLDELYEIFESLYEQYLNLGDDEPE